MSFHIPECFICDIFLLLFSLIADETPMPVVTVSQKPKCRQCDLKSSTRTLRLVECEVSTQNQWDL